MEITKIISENPLIDELIYHSKIMALDTIIKLEDEANKNETLESLKASDTYIACMEGKASLYMFSLTDNDLLSVGISLVDPNFSRYLENPKLIPEPFRTNLLNRVSRNYINNYEDQNNYYRMLNGLPEFKSINIPDQYVKAILSGIDYLSTSPNLDDHIDVSGLDLTKPLHKLTTKEIELIELIGEKMGVDYLYNILLLTNTTLRTYNNPRSKIISKRIHYSHWLFVPDEFTEEAEFYYLDLCCPIHEFDPSAITALEQIGVLDWLKEEYPTAKYLNFLGLRKIDIYKARKGGKFEILYVPTISTDEVYNNFYNRLLLNRDFVIKTIYSEAYKIKSDYYDNYLALLIIVLSLTDMIIEAPEYLIRRDLFDYRTIQYLLESYGVTFFPEIPLKYQQKLIKNLNLLLKYKSTPKCMKEICNLFDLKDITINRYFLLKNRRVYGENIFPFVDTTDIYLFYHAYDIEVNYAGIYSMKDKRVQGFDRVWYVPRVDDPTQSEFEISFKDNYWVLTDLVRNKEIARLEIDEFNSDPIGDWILLDNTNPAFSMNSRFGDNDIDNYILEFCKVPLDNSIETALRDPSNYRDYYTVITNDPYWLGDKSYDQIEQEILKQDFNCIRSKYISLDTIYDLSELALQRPYFFSLIFEKEKYTDILNLQVSTISQSKTFRFNDLVCYLLSLSYLYYGIKDEIKVSKDKIMHIIGFDFNNDITELQNYFINNEIKFDISKYDNKIEALQAYLEDNYIEDIDLSKFIPTIKYPNYDTLLNIYTSNLDLREVLVDRMNNASNKRIYNIYKTIYDATMIQLETHDFFKDVYGNYIREVDETGDNIVTYGAFVKSRDPVLGDSLEMIRNMEDETEKIRTISEIISASVEAIEYLMDSEEIKYVFSGLASVSYEAVTNYIRKLINFFKSFTVQIAEINNIYSIHMMYDNKLSPLDNISSLISRVNYKETIEIRDNLNAMISTKNLTDDISIYDRLFIDYFYEDMEVKNNG